MTTENNSSKTPWIIGGAVALVAIVGLIVFTDVDLTSTGELPTVNADAGELPEVRVEGGEMPSVDVEAGEMPTIDVDVADVNVGTKTIEVEVPTMEIDLPKEGQEADDLADNIDVDVDVDTDPNQ